MKRFGLGVVFLLLLTASVLASLNFPTLSGRVVDDAHILSLTTIQSLDQSLAAYEKSTTNQLVIVTVKSLQGVTIEQYGYQLGRAWGIGQKDKNNGVLLIVAPKERKVRIEVGYGLEGVLTDAMCSSIINGVILPDFRAGQMEKGIVDGVQAIMGGRLSQTTAFPEQGQQSNSYVALMFLILMIVMLITRLAVPMGVFFAASALGGKGFSASGGFSGGLPGFIGGFSGGGGGFGGGGASGGW